MDEAIELSAAVTMDHVDAIYRLIDQASKNSTVLPRTRAGIFENIRDFVIAVGPGGVVACGALQITTMELAEIKSLVVDESSRGKALGSRLVRVLVDQARTLKLRRLFVLTDSVPFFERNGFSRADKATLPHKVWNECLLCPKFDDCDEVAMDMDL